jgi:hypothetical protein
MHPKVVEGIVDHSQIFMLLDLYSHASPTLKHEAAGIRNTQLVANEEC